MIALDPSGKARIIFPFQNPELNQVSEVPFTTQIAGAGPGHLWRPLFADQEDKRETSLLLDIVVHLKGFTIAVLY